MFEVYCEVFKSGVSIVVSIFYVELESWVFAEFSKRSGGGLFSAAFRSISQIVLAVPFLRGFPVISLG